VDKFQTVQRRICCRGYHPYNRPRKAFCKPIGFANHSNPIANVKCLRWGQCRIPHIMEGDRQTWHDRISLARNHVARRASSTPSLQPRQHHGHPHDETSTTGVYIRDRLI
jgi:hypothetical protein